jgi:hypothetical protein
MAPLLKSSGSLEEIREIILGSHLQDLQKHIEHLARQVEALTKKSPAQRNYDRRLKRMRLQLNGRMDEYVRRAAVHKARTTVKVEQLAAEIRRVARRVSSDRRRRSALGAAMAKVADQLTSSGSRRSATNNRKPTNRRNRQSAHRTSNSNSRAHR